MADPDIALKRIPGVGLAFVDQASNAIVRAYAIAQGAEVDLEVAACFSAAVIDKPIPSSILRDDFVDKTVRVLLSDLAELLGRKSASDLNANLTAVTPRLELGCVDLEIRKDRHAPRPDWAGVQHFLSSKGINVRRRAAENAGKFTAHVALDTVPIFESLDSTGKVVSEGKGSNEVTALHSALGEAVERILAQIPDRSRMICSSSQHLQERGIAVPSLKAEYQDLFSDALQMDWVAATTIDDAPAALPAELVYYPYHPSLPVRAFSVQQTSGLAAGASREEAVIAALFETIETDAYWTSMRTHTVCGVFRNLGESADETIQSITRLLTDLGFQIHVGLINFDWPLSVVHVVLQSKSATMPALSHGLGSGVDHVQAIRRALLEAVQVYTGLQKVVEEYWPKVGLKPVDRLEPTLAWASPGLVSRIVGMFENAPSVSYDKTAPVSIEALFASMRERAITPYIADLGEAHGIHVVRLFLDGAVSTFSERGEPSRRLVSLANQWSRGSLYFDPILT